MGAALDTRTELETSRVSCSGGGLLYLGLEAGALEGLLLSKNPTRPKIKPTLPVVF